MKKTLWDMTQEVAVFFQKNKKDLSRDQAWHQAKLYIQESFEITPIEWACTLQEKKYSYERLFPLFQRKDIAFTPLSRLLGYQWFYGHKFYLNEATLDPRWESEGLVSLVIERSKLERSKPRKILDLGTGTGCLLISILHELAHSKGTGVDISPRALEMAQENALRVGVSDRTYWLQSNWCEHVLETFDYIVANPPYIQSDYLLPCTVKAWDPPQALYGGASGLQAYEEIIPHFSRVLEKGGTVFLEIGYDQASAICQLLSQKGFQDIRVETDLAGKDRYVIARGLVY